MNPQALLSIFGKVPVFLGSELLDIQLRRDGPTLFLRIMTKEPVEIKPKRWDKWDVIYVELSFIGIRDLAIDGLGTENQIRNFEVTNREEDGALHIVCHNQMQISCSFDWARVEEISPGLIGSP
ncbi:immunity 50 family protein [Brevibacillus migulae]|uniref:immunity 50 family protein n=1 Tax=Brevibacillus migulae TaxID=1644114 RepID=UPI0038B23160